jgi:hypothetical protein
MATESGDRDDAQGCQAQTAGDRDETVEPLDARRGVEAGEELP